ncbi:nitroreductase family protein [Pseudodesulfovibrio piezophilus]|uniref:Ferredoxin-nitroreductase protein n=1 Tax=Pseudodesulfovibrio piezophilus (strain DSM 21447 / JCM 15486 / C1TLV30) TaxID=1322246 RepID=M1WSA3_PSEP2|nr:nitroreductase family protein [Pseudodesulfovibrio piezophilus]CCH50064.1 Ferredoxin-nitroreductase protein [Pseudodesulfovibrio piezophilus C1TLV30]
MFQFEVDSELCIGCGECAADCPYSVIEMVDDFPTISEEKSKQCIECQHCLAICQPGALSIFGLDPAQSMALPGKPLDPAELELLMLGRRSIRRYKDEPVNPALLDSILEVVRHAPTAVNQRGTVLTVVEDKEAMDALRTRIYDALRQKRDAGELPEEMKFFAGVVKAWDAGKDILFRGAPHFLVVSNPADSPAPVADSLIAMNYFELLASAHGIGTVWDGLAKWALTIVVPEVASMLNIPDNHEIGYMMAFGMPAIRYHRTVQRPGGVVNKVTVEKSK